MKVQYLNMLNGSHWWHRVQLFLCNRKLKSSVCKTISVSDNNGMNRTAETGFVYIADMYGPCTHLHCFTRMHMSLSFNLISYLIHMVTYMLCALIDHYSVSCRFVHI